MKLKRITTIMFPMLFIMLLLVSLTACSCSHEWTAATCTTPKTCKVCGETEGTVSGHSYAWKLSETYTFMQSGKRDYACISCNELNYSKWISLPKGEWTGSGGVFNSYDRFTIDLENNDFFMIFNLQLLQSTKSTSLQK